MSDLKNEIKIRVEEHKLLESSHLVFFFSKNRKKRRNLTKTGKTEL